jgi:hypothetical protein
MDLIGDTQKGGGPGVSFCGAGRSATCTTAGAFSSPDRRASPEAIPLGQKPSTATILDRSVPCVWGWVITSIRKREACAERAAQRARGRPRGGNRYAVGMDRPPAPWGLSSSISGPSIGRSPGLILAEGHTEYSGRPHGLITMGTAGSWPIGARRWPSFVGHGLRPTWLYRLDGQNALGAGDA